ncbi:MAG: nitroreductase family protein [Desulfobacca sp.]|nr:nitroreductase family protein [Desulfobacca sp.]
MDVYEAIKNRRSHRLYKPDAISREVLARVIEAGLWAPSGTNLQPWEITVMSGSIRDQFVSLCAKSIDHVMPLLKKLFSEKQQKFTAQFFKNLGGAPVVIAVTVWREEDPFYRLNMIQSGAALMQNLLLAAEAEGLGTCWMTGVLYVENELLSFLGKEDRQLLAITPIGYPGKTPPVVPRKDREVRWLGF